MTATADALITVDTNPARSPSNRSDRRTPADREANHQKAPIIYRCPGNLHLLSGAAALDEYDFTMAMITTDAMGESAPSKTPGTCHFEARNASKAPDKPVAMSSL